MRENNNVWLWVIGIIVLLFIFGLGSLGMRSMTYNNYPTGYNMMGGYGWQGLGMGLGFLFMLLILGLFIWLIYILIENATRKSSRENQRRDYDDTSSILNKRYAKGEINKKQYEEMKKTFK